MTITKTQAKLFFSCVFLVAAAVIYYGFIAFSIEGIQNHFYCKSNGCAVNFFPFGLSLFWPLLSFFNIPYNFFSSFYFQPWIACFVALLLLTLRHLDSQCFGDHVCKWTKQVFKLLCVFYFLALIPFTYWWTSFAS